LLTSIHQRFAQEGIEMSFPTRDLHIKSMPKDWGVPGMFGKKSA